MINHKAFPALTLNTFLYLPTTNPFHIFVRLDLAAFFNPTIFLSVFKSSFVWFLFCEIHHKEVLRANQTSAVVVQILKVVVRKVYNKYTPVGGAYKAEAMWRWMEGW